MSSVEIMEELNRVTTLEDVEQTTKEPEPVTTRPRNRESYQSIMNAFLVSGYEHVHGTPDEQKQNKDKGKGKAPTPPDSPSTTEPLHLGFPFREKTDHDDDLPDDIYKRPYLAAQVHAMDGDPRVIGTNGINQPLYDEAKLIAQPMEDIDEDMEN